MDFENELVAHRKIDADNPATVEKHCPERDIINFRAAENTVVERAIYESHCQKSARGKIAMAECTAFKLSEVGFLFAIGNSIVFNIGKIISH
jgi:hypothetical protein